ncbi:hypothetical protein Lal_00033473 [Lupinus albus]|nr:hypothetical protein Lal_00033473 [Lupinus albus]
MKGNGKLKSLNPIFLLSSPLVAAAIANGGDGGSKPKGHGLGEVRSGFALAFFSVLFFCSKSWDSKSLNQSSILLDFFSLRVLSAVAKGNQDAGIHASHHGFTVVLDREQDGSRFVDIKVFIPCNEACHKIFMMMVVGSQNGTERDKGIC